MNIVIKGSCSEAIVYTDYVEPASYSQIQAMVNSELFRQSTIRIMPDVHAGKGSVIGFTSTIGDKICANIVGVDIGCGVTLDRFKAIRGIDFANLDKVIRQHIPSGFDVRDGVCKILTNSHSILGHLYDEIKDELIGISRKIGINSDRVLNSIGSLGGGNHFCEIVKGDDGEYGLHIHSGSRGFGAKVAEYHQNKAYNNFDSGLYPVGTNKSLTWLEGEDFKSYVNDMKVAQKYATLNRMVMAYVINEYMRWDFHGHIESVHNYIDFDAGIIRKGAISAQNGEVIVIPISMADGVIVGTGRGNSDWNYSAPHGAGRLFSRGDAKRNLSMDTFKDSMSHVWSSCVNTGTLDESPQAYKGLDFILSRIQDNVEVNEVLKPVYNFKAGGCD